MPRLAPPESPEACHLQCGSSTVKRYTHECTLAPCLGGLRVSGVPDAARLPVLPQCLSVLCVGPRGASPAALPRSLLACACVFPSCAPPVGGGLQSRTCVLLRRDAVTAGTAPLSLFGRGLCMPRCLFAACCRTIASGAVCLVCLFDPFGSATPTSCMRDSARVCPLHLSSFSSATPI